MTAGDGQPGIAQLAVFLSGAGRTLVNLAQVIKFGDLAAEIGLVVASRECKGLERAKTLGFPVRVIEGVLDERTLEQLLDEFRIDWVVLAGYLKKLPIPENWEGRVVNIHPALLPDFGGPGMFGDRVHQAVLNSGVAETGCTVHLCDDRYDTGPIVLQRRCAVSENDTLQSLADRVFKLESEAYPEALRILIHEAVAPGGVQGTPTVDPTIEGRPEGP